MTQTAQVSTRTQRLDALPFTAEHRRLLVGSGAGWALDALDVGLISFIIAQLTVQWRLSATDASLIASIGFVGMAIGAALGGLLADRLGRRQVFALTLLGYGVFTGFSALAWSVGALIVFRFLVGLGLGAELPVASTLVSEFAPARIRGRVVVVLESFWAVGWTLAALIGFLVVPRGENGWRWALALGALPALYAVVVTAAAARVGPLPRVPRPLGRGRGGRAALRGCCRSAAGRDPRAGRGAGPRRRPRREPRPSPGRRPVVASPPPPHGGGLGGVVPGQLLLLRRVHLAADAARGLGLLPGALLRLHPADHAGPAAGLRGVGRARGALGPPADAGDVPPRLRGRRRAVRRRRTAPPPCSRRACCSRSSTSAPGVPSTR